METKNSFIRKAIALAMCGVMVFSLTSCTGDRDSSEDSSISNPITEPTSGDPVEPEQTVLDNINAAFAVNNDVVGWLTVPGTEIDEQIVQGDTNTEYERLSWDRKDADGNGVPDYDFYGCYFADTGNTFGNRNDLSRNTIIYGHNMKTGTIFGCLTEYKKAAYYQEHPYIEFDTLYGDAKYEVFAAFAIDVVQDTSFVYNQYVDMDEDTYNDYVAEVIRRSDVDSGIRPEYGEQLLTLSTCEYSSANGRYVVVARKVSS